LCKSEVTLSVFAALLGLTLTTLLFHPRRGAAVHPGRRIIPSSLDRSIAERSASFRRNSIVLFSAFWLRSWPAGIFANAWLRLREASSSYGSIINAREKV